jgi:hypothetical protein
MGNWKTVNITGTIPEAEIQPLRDWLGYSHDDGDPGWEHFGPLSFNRESPSLAGLNDWVRTTVFACGNLAERDYSTGNVAEELRRLLEIAPGMRLKVHCGGDWESGTCTATITVAEGHVTIGPPEAETVAPVSDEQAAGNLLRNLTRPR